ncbi:unnamed protein product [Notodromas monacha]|uniref:Uncharacterized protein n=1 Tax=Notodromas monacha TaxID=399045 RepID=A0A7R9BVT3_9CRUS|nr:unnamed protein product [Notodromas monacha]CAG0922303.1 unnamed protein product [Notodromas monacha]
MTMTRQVLICVLGLMVALAQGLEPKQEKVQVDKYSGGKPQPAYSPQQLTAAYRYRTTEGVAAGGGGGAAAAAAAAQPKYAQQQQQHNHPDNYYNSYLQHPTGYDENTAWNQEAQSAGPQAIIAAHQDWYRPGIGAEAMHGGGGAVNGGKNGGGNRRDRRQDKKQQNRRQQNQQAPLRNAVQPQQFQGDFNYEDYY